MEPTPLRIAGMIDISAVQASHGIAEIMEMVENAIRYGFISIHTLPCWVGDVRHLMEREFDGMES